MPPAAFAASHAVPLRRPGLARVCPAAAPRPRRSPRAVPAPTAALRGARRAPLPSEGATPGQGRGPPPALWAVLRGAANTARLAVLSAALLCGAGASLQRAHAGGAASPSATTRSAPSDVEAAAMTLAAVSVGGLVMRVLVNGRRDESAAQGRVEAECARLAEEERNRALRKERRRMEGGVAPEADGADGDDDTLMSELRQRMATLGDDAPSADAEPADASAPEKNVTGAAPSGMGSAVLERPDGAAGADGAADAADADTDGDAADGDGADEASEEKLASSDEQDMLKRMWNLSPPDKEQK